MSFSSPASFSFVAGFSLLSPLPTMSMAASKDVNSYPDGMPCSLIPWSLSPTTQMVGTRSTRYSSALSRSICRL